jgi:hypothetical protein
VFRCYTSTYCCFSYAPFLVLCTACVLRLLFAKFGSDVRTQGRGYSDWSTHFGAGPCGITRAHCKCDIVSRYRSLDLEIWVMVP